jgi:hypothetical protein
LGYEWNDLDSFLKWNIRREPGLPPRLVHSLVTPEGEWRVRAKRGTRSTGNKDLLVLIDGPREPTETIESLKQLVEDLSGKCDADRDWMKQFFMPALVAVVALGSNPDDVLLERMGLPGYPSATLLNTLQVIALTEHRKYGRSEPFGGKYLLVRVCAGLTWGVWTTTDVTYGALMQDTVAVLRAQTGIREPTLGLVLAQSGLQDSFVLERRELQALSL